MYLQTCDWDPTLNKNYLNVAIYAVKRRIAATSRLCADVEHTLENMNAFAVPDIMALA